jgi:hypothetical protein
MSRQQQVLAHALVGAGAGEVVCVPLRGEWGR